MMGNSLTSSVILILLSSIYGTLPLMCFFAVRWTNSPSLLIALKCGITAAISLGSLLYLICCRNQESSQLLLQNIKSWRAYAGVLIRALLHIFLPFFFGSLSMLFLPLTLFSLFMVASIWLKWVIERLFCVKSVTIVRKSAWCGAALGVLGIFLSLVPTIYKSTWSCKNNNETIYVGSYYYGIDGVSKANPYQLTFPYQGCYKGEHIAFATCCLVCACISWAIAQIFWSKRRNKVDHSFLMFGQNIGAIILSMAVWIPLRYRNIIQMPTWDYSEGIFAIVFLGGLSGWLGPILIQYLKQKRGSGTVENYLVAIPVISFVEDCFFIRDVMTSNRMIVAVEALGILMVCAGLFISNTKEEILLRKQGYYETLLAKPENEEEIPYECYVENTEKDEDQY